MMKRTLSLLLCFVMLLSCVTFLFSCKKDEDDDDPSTDEVQGVDLSGYAIITGKELTASGKQFVLDFARKASVLTTVDMSVLDDTSADVVKSKDLEILIGVTSREESVKTYNDIKGSGWAVRVFKHKIAIVGTTPYLTTVALSWFEQTYLNAEHVNGTTLSVQGKYVVSDLPVLSLTENDATFAVVCEKGRDSSTAPHQIGSKVCESLLQKTGLTAQFVTTDAEIPEKAILVGNMSRTDFKEEIAKIEADEYAVTVKDNKVYLVAWSDAVLPEAYELFEEMLFASALTDANGNITSYNIPGNCTVVKKYASDWFTDFPKPVAEGLYPEAAVDVNDGSLQYIYAGSGATRETFVAYCETLKAAGYTPMGNGDVQWEGSSFRTFVNNEKGVSLHVSHMAFSHAEEQGVDLFKNSIRIVSGHTEWGGKLVSEQYFRPQVEGVDYVDKMDSQITANLIDYSASGNWGLGQILTLADGSFIVIDGGKNKTPDDTANLWEIMCEMHKKAWGSKPTKDKPIHIRAWIITHEHGDHIDLVRSFCDQYGPKAELKFDYMMVNFGSRSQLPVGWGNTGLRDNLKAYQDKVKNGFEYIQISTGQVFYFANCRLEILATIDDWAIGNATGDHNETSTIFRTALIEYDDQGNPHETTSMWTGDARWHLSRMARAMYGSFLKSDQVQISHHGLYGVEGKFYDLVGAELIWLPDSVNQGVADRFFYLLTNPDTGYTVTTAFLNPNTKYLIFNGSNYTDYPMWSTTLTISASGPKYDEMYDPVSGEDIRAKAELWPVIDVPAYRAALGK